MCSTVVCCNSIVLCNSVCADRSGMAAPKLLEGYLFSSTGVRFWLSFASHSRQIALELLHHGWDLSVRICTEHCVFSGKRRFRCGEKLAHMRDGFGRRRFAAESGSICARVGTEGLQVTFSLFCSPHLCVGFLFLILYPAAVRLPSSASRRPPPVVRLPSSASNHNVLTHTTCHHTTCPHTPCPHNLSTHNFPTHNLSTHNLSSHHLLTHNLPPHNLLSHTTCLHTTCYHTTCSHHNLSW